MVALIHKQSVATVVLLLSIMLVLSLIILGNRLPINDSSSHADNSPIGQFRFQSRKNIPPPTTGQFSTLCPIVSPHLVGWTDLSILVDSLGQENSDTLFEADMKKAGLKEGGSFSPRDCQSRNKVAIIVPYRNRTENLTVFLRHMHPFLQRQQLDYTIFLVEQADNLPFNRGTLFNIGYVEAQRRDTFQCFIFHDVDLLPEDDRNFYSCPEDGKPRHLSFVIDIYDYKPLSLMVLFGGVIAVSASDYNRFNGYSNEFWGLGLEDDDFYRRIRSRNVTIVHPQSTEEYLKYRTFYHDSIKLNPDRQKMFDSGYLRFETDGLVNLQNDLSDFKLEQLYTHLVARIRMSKSYFEPVYN